MINEFKQFLNKGNVVYTAVGLVIALYFQKIVDAFIAAIIDPLIALMFGKGDVDEIVISVGTTEFRVGLIINAAITFIFVAFILFLIVRAYDRSRPAEEEAAAPTEIELLTEIRDSLAK